MSDRPPRLSAAVKCDLHAIYDFRIEGGRFVGGVADGRSISGNKHDKRGRPLDKENSRFCLHDPRTNKPLKSDLEHGRNFVTTPEHERDHGIPAFDKTDTKLLATWQFANAGNVDPTVRTPVGKAESYEQLAATAERHVDVTAPHDEASLWRYTETFHQKWRGASKSYGDLRRHGKIRFRPDITYAQEAYRQGEEALHGRIDKAAPARRRQIGQRRQANLQRWGRDRRQPKRLLYLLKQPRALVEVFFLMEVLAWVLSQPKPIHRGAIRILSESTSKSVNCVSDEAAERSKENDKRGTPRRQRVVFLSRAEELDLARRAKDGDVPARNRLFIAQWPLVASIARKHTGLGAATEDLIQEAYGGVNGDGNPVGLVYALNQYDPEKGIRFSTFARNPIEWAIKDCKREERKQYMPSLNTPIVPGSDDATTWEERIPDLGVYAESEEGATKTISTRTSRSIRNRVARGTITAHISPYANGLAPETLAFVAELNAEAVRFNTGVKYVGLANKIEATGDVHCAANCPTSLGGWFLRRAAQARYLDGEEWALQLVNSQWRKELRKRAKRKPK